MNTVKDYPALTHALSIRQPWAWLIVNGYKHLENRTWSTTRRGPIFIHTGQTFDPAGFAWVRATFPTIPMPRPEGFDLGGITGIATITDCICQSRSKWFSGPKAFLLTDRAPLTFHPCPGRLQFFKPTL